MDVTTFVFRIPRAIKEQVKRIVGKRNTSKAIRWAIRTGVIPNLSPMPRGGNTEQGATLEDQDIQTLNDLARKLGVGPRDIARGYMVLLARLSPVLASTVDWDDPASGHGILLALKDPLGVPSIPLFPPCRLQQGTQYTYHSLIVPLDDLAIDQILGANISMLDDMSALKIQLMIRLKGEQYGTEH